MSFTSKLNWSSYIISVAKTTSKKITLTGSVKFLSCTFALVSNTLESLLVKNVHLFWFNWFLLFSPMEGLLIIVIRSMIFLSPFLDGISMFMEIISSLQRTFCTLFQVIFHREQACFIFDTFLIFFLYAFILPDLSFLVTPCFSMSNQLCRSGKKAQKKDKQRKKGNNEANEGCTSSNLFTLMCKD